MHTVLITDCSHDMMQCVQRGKVLMMQYVYLWVTGGAEALCE
jgi:hypothetical protein